MAENSSNREMLLQPKWLDKDKNLLMTNFGLLTDKMSTKIEKTKDFGIC
jgi:hypothetical protein